MPAHPLHRNPALVALVAAGGAVGTAARHGLALAFPEGPGAWPATTFVVNIVGAFLLGLLLEALVRKGGGAGRATRVRLGVGTGMLGAFTTYSTLAVDTDLLVHRGLPASAVTYALATVVAGLITCGLGIVAGSRLRADGA